MSLRAGVNALQTNIEIRHKRKCNREPPRSGALTLGSTRLHLIKISSSFEMPLTTSWKVALLSAIFKLRGPRNSFTRLLSCNERRNVMKKPKKKKKITIINKRCKDTGLDFREGCGP